MPGEDGESLSRRIKADSALKATKMFLIASVGINGNRKNLTDIGFEGFLLKPVRQSHLRLLLEGAMGGGFSLSSVDPQSSLTPETISAHGRVLVAEDNATNQLVAVSILKKLGQRVDVAANGKEAIAALRGIPYDLVLMDCQMPEMDGFEATRRIRSGEAGKAHRSTPIIAMTARAMQGDREKCLDAGMDDYLSKPIDFGALSAALDRWLSVSTEVVEEDRDGPPSATTKLIFDKAALSDRLMGDQDLVREVLSVFLDDAPRRIAELRRRISEGNAAGAGEQAHATKGAAANVGGEALRKTAFEMEKAGKGKDMETLVAMMPELERAFTQLSLFMGSAS